MMRLAPIGVSGRMRPATGTPLDPGAADFIAAKPLAKRHLLLHHVGCGKQNLVYSGGLFLYFRLIETGFRPRLFARVQKEPSNEV